VWREACVAAGSPPLPLPVHRVVKERRAAVSALPDHQAARPPAATRWRNVFLAGDWTATGLPSTMEGAIRSGFSAAQCVLNAAAQSALKA
ncbi:MAG TPA: FAD-dependent oxidoreductase, partial [Azospirillaceae bacterium]|nr:FAD-dependent oxidoreductase [Azospirillaceae bacterium]